MHTYPHDPNIRGIQAFSAKVCPLISSITIPIPIDAIQVRVDRTPDNNKLYGTQPNRGNLLSIVVTPVAYLYCGISFRHNLLAVKQRWSAYTVEPVYSGHPWNITSWLLYRGGLLIQWNLYIVVTLGTLPVGCYTEVVYYSGTCI